MSERNVYYLARAANRLYMADNLDPSSEGNYLCDFVEAYERGDIYSSEKVRFFGGSPTCKGQGFVVVSDDDPEGVFAGELRKAAEFLNLRQNEEERRKLHRRIEDHLQKLSYLDDDILFQVARLVGAL